MEPRTPNQRRRDRRFQQWCKTSVRVVGGSRASNGTPEIEAFTYDLSLGGARILAPERFDVGCVLQLRVDLARTREILNVEALVKWARPHEQENLYEIGVEFLHSSSQTIMGLMKNLHSITQ